MSSGTAVARVQRRISAPLARLRADPATPVLERRVPAARPRRQWLVRYQWVLFSLDLTAATTASAVAYLARPDAGRTSSALLALSVALPLGWVAFLAANRAYDGTVLGVGADEFRRVALACVWLTAVLSFCAFAAQASIARGFVLVVLPATLILDLLLRYGARKRLHRLRRAGIAMSRVLAVGGQQQIVDLVRATRRDAYGGLQVVGACVVDTQVGVEALSVPIFTDLDHLLERVEQDDIDAVAVTGTVSPAKLRWISWQLEGSGADLIVSPGLVEVSGTRLHVRPLLSTVPMLQVEAPRLTGFHRMLKAGFDRGIALGALLLLAPVFAVIAIVIRLGSHGPALFRQVRVGRDGRPFVMIKFRSMFIEAEAQLAELAVNNDAADGPLFKIRNDPRVTPIGRFLRRYSIDELPQLVNVVTGRMSLVGPRPPLPSEVTSYDDDVRRRLLVRPGITGLWQVSGRSDLSWTEAVSLDLRYIENWSIATDLFILWKTVRAVLGGAGAY